MARHYQQGCVDVVVLDERLVAETVAEAQAALPSNLAQSYPRLVVDMRAVRCIDSPGLEWLNDLHDHCRRRGGDLQIAAPSRLIADVFAVTGLDERLTVADDVIAAAAEFVP